MKFRGYNFRWSRKVVDLPKSINKDHDVPDNYVMFGRVCDPKTNPDAILTTWKHNAGTSDERPVYAKIVPIDYHLLTNMILGKDGYWYLMKDGKCYVSGDRKRQRRNERIVSAEVYEHMMRAREVNKKVDPIIEVHYWYSDLSTKSGLKKGQKIPFNELGAHIQWCAQLGLNVMIQTTGFEQKNHWIFWIDDKRFSQR